MTNFAIEGATLSGNRVTQFNGLNIYTTQSGRPISFEPSWFEIENPVYVSAEYAEYLLGLTKQKMLREEKAEREKAEREMILAENAEKFEIRRKVLMGEDVHPYTKGWAFNTPSKRVKLSVSFDTKHTAHFPKKMTDRIANLRAKKKLVINQQIFVNLVDEFMGMDTGTQWSIVCGNTSYVDFKTSPRKSFYRFVVGGMGHHYAWHKYSKFSKENLERVIEIEEKVIINKNETVYEY
jgi:hypothetical protein